MSPIMHGIVRAAWMMKAHSHLPPLLRMAEKEKPIKMPSGLVIDNSVIHIDFSLSEPKASVQTGA
jgi:hypothetical protein